MLRSSLSLSLSLLLPIALGLAASIGDIRDAQACGGCFHQEPVNAGTSVITSVVTDHRMVFKLSRQETILWDQVRYTGSPEEFAWVLPVRAGAKVELSRDAWIAALDATTKTTVTGPQRFCGGGGGGSSSGSSSGGGCGSSLSALSDTSAGGRSAAQDGGFAGNDQVNVINQSVIGPYQAVTLRPTNGEGIVDWLVANKFAIPTDVRPVVEAYTDEGFDFIALRLRPGQGVQAMRPVRVVTQGADPTLPLRMVAAGVGAKVGLTLWVVAEGRYETSSFPPGVVSDSQITWDGPAGRSNFTQLESDLLAANGGRTWITQVSHREDPTVGSVGSLFDPTGSRLSLPATYQSACLSRPVEKVPCNDTDLPPSDGQPDDNNDTDAGAAASDAGEDASTGDGGTSTPPKDAGTGTGTGQQQCFKYVSGCEGFDDMDVAKRGINSSDFWVTRLRADLPANALSTDLRLQAADQVEISGTHKTDNFSDPKFDPCAGQANSSSSSSGASNNDDGGCACRTSSPLGGSLSTWLVLGVGAAVGLRKARRRSQIRFRR